MGLATKFWAKNPEVAEHNQYWYSEKTIAAIVDEVRGGPRPWKCCRLCLPLF